jgi:Leucine-rich repeat (LRR) protein
MRTETFYTVSTKKGNFTSSFSNPFGNNYPTEYQVTQPNCEELKGRISINYPSEILNHKFTLEKEGIFVQETAGSSVIEFKNLTPGSYHVRIQDTIDFCGVQSIKFDIIEFHSNTGNVSASDPFTKTCTINSAGKQIGETAISDATYTWSPITGLSNPNAGSRKNAHEISNPIANPDETTVYTVTRIDTSGCISIDSVVANVDSNCNNEYTAIPDKYFEQRLIELGIDSGSIDGAILTSKISSVTHLDISKNTPRINDLTGIEGFTALIQFNCSANDLSELDLSKNTALTTVLCTANDLTTLDFSKNTALTGLSGSLNDLTSINLLENKALTILVINANDLTKIDLSGNTALDVIFCDGNDLTELDLSKNTALRRLHCDYNNLTSLDLSKNKKLEELLFVANNLETIDLSQNTALTKLECDANELITLDVSKNTALTKLECDTNELTALDVSKNIALTELSCRRNELKTLNLSKNKKLKTLDCNSNDLLRINLKNKKNSSMNTPDLTRNNSSLCIQVDNVKYAKRNWSRSKDNRAQYKSVCKNTILKKSELKITYNQIDVYPNPIKNLVKKEVHINNILLKEVSIYTNSGNLLKTIPFTPGTLKNTIDVSELSSGIYYVHIKSSDTTTVTKAIIIE